MADIPDDDTSIGELVLALSETVHKQAAIQNEILQLTLALLDYVSESDDFDEERLKSAFVRHAATPEEYAQAAATLASDDKVQALLKRLRGPAN